VPIVAAVSLDEAGHPIHAKVAKVKTFSINSDRRMGSGRIGTRMCRDLSDGLACFSDVAEVGCLHQPVVVNGRHPKDLPDFRWINTVISNLKTSFSGTFHAYILRSELMATWAPSVIGSIVASTWKR
jgi:hypothetical protein